MSIRTRRGVLAAVAVLVVLVAIACQPVKSPPEPPPRQFPPFGDLVETDPGLFPHFSTGIKDYVSRCDANTAVLFSVNAPADTTVSVDGQAAQSGQFNTFTVRDFSQSFTIVVQGPSGPPTTHYVRCLPPDFPDWSASRNGATQADFYLTSPTGYPVIFDNNGVPMWWYTGSSPQQAFSTFFDNGHVAFGVAGGPPGPGGLPQNARFEEHALDGSLVQSFNTFNGANEASDGHDAIRLVNGHYVMVTSKLRGGENLAFDWADPNAPTNVTIIDHVIQEIDPANPTVPVWSWDTRDHISPSETDPQWRNTVLATGAAVGLYDVYHWNSVEWTGNGVVLSYRHLDAVYNVAKSDNSIVWKLGGSDHVDIVNNVPAPKSLAISDPSFANFGGQHDARLLSDSSVALHDNGSGLNRAPRAVRYTINTNNPPLGKVGTATRAEQITDSLAPSSFCCGSARRLPGVNGNWVMGWGGTGSPPGSVADQVIEEKQGDGTLIFALQIHGLSNPLYRGTPILPTQLTREQLRSGMDGQVASQSAGAQSKSQATVNGKIGPEPAP